MNSDGIHPVQIKFTKDKKNQKKIAHFHVSDPFDEYLDITYIDKLVKTKYPKKILEKITLYSILTFLNNNLPIRPHVLVCHPLYIKLQDFGLHFHK